MSAQDDVNAFFAKKNLDKLKPDQPIVNFLLDESGPMAPQRETTLTGFNNYIKILQGNPKIALNLYKFHTQLMTVCEGLPISQANGLITKENYNPHGGMHIIRCALQMLHRLEKLTEGRPNLIIITIQRDAEDTSGDAWQMLKAAIQRKKRDGWQFQLLGCACTNPYPMADRMGIDMDHTISYDSPTASIAFEKTASLTLDFINGKKKDMAYLPRDREEVKDRFTPAPLRLIQRREELGDIPADLRSLREKFAHDELNRRK